VANPQVLGGWKLVGQTATIEAFAPTAKPSPTNKPIATTLQLADKGETGNPLLIWSGDRMMDLSRYQALQMKTKKIADKEYLFVEAGGFSTKNKPGWTSPWFVFARN
jgi:hypothetical protein